MTDSNKLWVIDLVDEVIHEQNDAPSPEISRPSEPSPASVRRTAVTPRRVVPTKTQVPSVAPARRLHFASLLTLSYLLGPLALLLWARGKKSLPGIITAIVSPLGIGALLYTWPRWLAGEKAVAAGTPILLAMLAALLMLSLAAFACWTRALHCTFNSRTRAHSALPLWMRSRWGITISGFLAPGLGFFLNGKPHRAVAAVWALWPGTFALLVLLRAETSWHWLTESLQGFALQSQAFGPLPEYILLGTLAVALLGGVTWLVQALGGLHLRSRLANEKSRYGDRYALALLTAVVTLAVVMPPAEMAHFIHDQSLELTKTGLQVAPMNMARSAMELAPDNRQYHQTFAALSGSPLENLQQPFNTDSPQPSRQRGGSIQNPSIFLATMAAKSPQESVPIPSGQKATPATDESTRKMEPTDVSPNQSDGEPGPM